MIKQEVITVVLSGGTTTANALKNIVGGKVKQIQAYHNNTDNSVMKMVKFRDGSGSDLIPAQPIENLRSRDGGYFQNMPLDFKGGQNVTVFVENSASVVSDTVYTFVLDIETNENC